MTGPRIPPPPPSSVNSSAPGVPCQVAELLLRNVPVSEILFTYLFFDHKSSGALVLPLHVMCLLFTGLWCSERVCECVSALPCVLISVHCLYVYLAGSFLCIACTCTLPAQFCALPVLVPCQLISVHCLYLYRASSFLCIVCTCTLRAHFCALPVLVPCWLISVHCICA